MATLINPAWNLPLASFVSRVLQKCGVLASSETASAADYALVLDVINGTIKALHADGLLWWAVNTEPMDFASGVDALPVPLDFSEAVFAYWVGAAGRVRLIERGEYEAIFDKTQDGTPEVLFVDGEVLRLWPVPSADGTLRLTYQREIADAEGIAPLAIPPSIVKPMVDLIAAEVLPYFGVPMAAAARLERDAARATMTLRQLSVQRAEPAPVQAEYL